MAKKKTEQTTAIELLTLDYKLAELPSSQHRAGLAGLVLIVRSLQKTESGTICEVTRLDDNGLTLQLNQAGVEVVFDEIYAATLEPQEYSKPKTKGKGDDKQEIPWIDIKEIESVDSRTKKTIVKKIYIYEDVIPKGSFLSDPTYDRSSDGKNGLWIKLWRDMVWSILRGVPATRKPFEERAKGKYNEDAIKVWQQLIQPEEFTVDLPSTYFLGAQANNAENTPFKDRARFQFLLHFWLYATQIYVPTVIDNEGKRNFVGYALAIPDVRQLQRFCNRLQKSLRDRGIEQSGYRPRDCLVDLAVESALDMMARLSERLTQSTGEQKTASTVLGIDVIHAEKQGNNVRILGISRLDPENSMINEYSRIRNNCWNPLFRKQRLLNLVNHSPWYSGFDSLLCTIPYERSIENDYFKHDVREELKHEVDSMATETDKTTEAYLAQLVFKLVKNYVIGKLESKHQLTWSKVKGKPEEEKDYNEKKAKIAKSAFLDVRSRTEGTDFINYFVSSLCSVPQYMNVDDYAILTKALYDENSIDRVRGLTLLALSANS